jgi:hypothetical protein
MEEACAHVVGEGSKMAFKTGLSSIAERLNVKELCEKSAQRHLW